MFRIIQADAIKNFSLLELYNIIFSKIPMIVKGTNDNVCELKSLCKLNGVKVYEA